MATSVKTGFIGIGDQGGPIARRIVEGGFDLMLWARRPDALEAYADTKATYAPSVPALGAACDVVGVCVYADADVEQVVGELLSAMRPGGIILIHSTASPDLCVRLAAQGAERSVTILDAPVSGGRARAATGEMAVMVGGDRDAYARVLPILATFATKMAWLGKSGSGQICKLINNAIATVHFATALDFFEAAGQLGMDRDALAGMLASGSAQSFMLEAAAAVKPEGLAFGFVRLEKDVALMLDVLDGSGLSNSRAATLSRRCVEDYAEHVAAAGE
ncbi:NAD(P)-dependent oxidoreductase [soil metagenome]